MPRIRTIKPEFPQSESMGRVSRDARLLFVQLWTLCDDSGRTRAASRMLASLLYPYDDDAPSLIPGWLDELAAEGCVDLYEVGGSKYLQVRKWLNHQKIDKPSASRFPEFDEASRILARIRECSSGDLGPGPRTKDLGRDLDRERTAPEPSAPARATRLPVGWQPTEEQIAWAQTRRPDVDASLEAETFRNFWTAKSGKDATKVNWDSTWRNWIIKSKPTAVAGGKSKTLSKLETLQRMKNGYAESDLVEIAAPALLES